MLSEIQSQSRDIWNSCLAFACLLTGFCGLFCPLCLECDIARHYGECFCWPLLPGSTFALRTGTRERHKIRVSVFGCMGEAGSYENQDAFQTCDWKKKKEMWTKMLKNTTLGVVLWCSGLSIWHGHCSSLGSCCAMCLTPGPGTSTNRWRSQKRK